MKKILLLATLLAVLLIAPAAIAFAEGKSREDTYKKTLAEVLKDVEKRYGIIFADTRKLVEKQDVTFAEFRYRFSLDETLDNILGSVGLGWRRDTKNTKKIYINKQDFFRVTAAEAEKRIDYLTRRFDTLPKWEARKKVIIDNIWSKLTLNPMPRKTPIKAVYSNKRTYDGYTVENLSLEIMPGIYLAGCVYKPTQKYETYPLMLTIPGHSYFGDNINKLEEKGRFTEEMQKRCGSLAKMGMVVFGYDPFGWGDSGAGIEFEDHNNSICIIMMTLYAIRSLDYFCTLPEIDKNRIAITGESGGGTYSYFEAALDERITMSIPVVILNAARISPCACSSGMPVNVLDGEGLVNNVEIAACIAPRLQLIVSGGNDPMTSAYNNVREYPFIKKIYTLHDLAAKVENAHIPNGKHDYEFDKRRPVYDFVSKHFGLDDKRIKDKDGNYNEDNVVTESPGTMLVWGLGGNLLPKDAVRGVDNYWKTIRELQK
jgi:hypothetical protein